MPFWEIVLIIAVLSAGGFVQSISGFGYALFTSPIISAFIAPSRAVVIIAIAIVALYLKLKQIEQRQAAGN